MAWQKFTRTRRVDRETPMITLNKSHFYYNAVAARMLEFKDGKRVVYHIDEANRKIGFEFITEDADYSYSVFAKANSAGFRSTSQDVVATYCWAKAVALLQDSSDRRFRLRPDANLWVAQLCRAFETKVLRSGISSIATDATGIYRYLNSGIIVYIGKGKIRSRLNESGRDRWQFDTIEYSLVPDENQQYEWESYWIDRFKEANNDVLPSYNVIAGRTV